MDNPDAAETPAALEAFLEGVVNKLPTPIEQGMSFDLGTFPVELARIRQGLDQWVRLRPGKADQVQGLVWRGRFLVATGDHVQGTAAFREALERDPDSQEARMQLVLAIALQSPREAQSHLRILHERDPRNGSVLHMMAMGLRGMGKAEEAKPLLDQVLAADPNNVAVLMERALVDLDLQDVAKAETRLRRALELAPGEPAVHTALSRCLHLAGKAEEADHHRQRSAQLEAERQRQKEMSARRSKPTVRDP
jgi:tetratricopeptide (TPR) repeat protein